MSRRIRLFLLCLVALALPLQGIAAATMLNCDHGATWGSGAAMAQAARMTPGAPHDHAAMLKHQHQYQHQHQAHAQVEKSGCGACAACCVGLAVASSLPDLPVPLLPSTSLRADDDAPRAGTPPVVLERPPRPLA